MSKVPEIIQKRAKILSNVHLKGNYYRLALDSPEIAAAAQPGQFVMLRLANDYQPFLRRPFSIHKLNYGHRTINQKSISKKNKENRFQAASYIEILYEVLGKGTMILSEKRPGEYLDTLGPLGKGFSLSADSYRIKSILVAGGMGVAPLFFLAQWLKRGNVQHARRNTVVLIGAKTKKEILSQKEFANIGLNVRICTEDGSSGFKGKVTELLAHLLKTKGCDLSTIYACGPRPMLIEVCKISKRYNIQAQVSLEEYMACGLGVCLGCMIKTKEGQKLVCKDGPVFDVSKII